MIVFLVFLIALQRLWELQISGSNVAQLRRRGAVEYGSGHYPYMVLLHVCWLLSIVWEWSQGPRFLGWRLVAWAVLGLILGQALRWYAIKTLGRRWCTRVLVLPGEPKIQKGLFGLVSHPNYIGVMLETICLPLIGSCVYTALVFGLLNAALLLWRIRVEQAALTKGAGMKSYVA